MKRLQTKPDNRWGSALFDPSVVEIACSKRSDSGERFTSHRSPLSERLEQAIVKKASLVICDGQFSFWAKPTFTRYIFQKFDTSKCIKTRFLNQDACFLNQEERRQFLISSFSERDWTQDGIVSIFQMQVRIFRRFALPFAPLRGLCERKYRWGARRISCKTSRGNWKKRKLSSLFSI